MKILLIYPPFLEARVHEEEISAPPLGLYYVGALLKEKDYHVEILNWAHMGKSSDRIVQTLREKRPDILGFSILQANRWGALEIAKSAKTVNPDVTVVFGGIGATFLWKHFLSHFNAVDFCVLGEGEYPFLKLIRAIEKGNPKSFKSIFLVLFVGRCRLFGHIHGLVAGVCRQGRPGKKKNGSCFQSFGHFIPVVSR